MTSASTSGALAVLRLVRFPNTLTAFADVVAGALIAGVDPTRIECLLAALGSSCLYGGGVALNDLWDLDKDRRLHPERVLPSGLLSPLCAAMIGGALMAFGLATAWVAGPVHLVVTLALGGSILLYDRLPDGWRLRGSAVMGTCRALNIARGLTLGAALSGSVWVPPVVGHWALIFLVTVISTYEDRPETPARKVRWVSLMLALPYVAPAWVAHVRVGSLLGTAGTALLGVLLAVYVVRPAWSGPPRPGRVVRNAIFTLVLLDALHALAVQDLVWATGLCILLPVMNWLARIIRQRGS